MGQYASYQHTAAADTSALPSAALWKKLDALSERKGRTYGIWIDFVDVPMVPTITAEIGALGFGGKLFGDANGTITQVTDEVGGVWALANATDNEACIIGAETMPFEVASDRGLIAFEARVKCVTVGNTESNVFIGLCEDITYSETVPLTAAGALSDNNMIGFHRKEADGNVFDFSYKANGITAVDLVEDAHTIVADEFVKLGWIFDPDISTTVECYVNGQKIAHSATTPTVGTAGTDMPNDAQLGWIFAHLAASGTPGAAEIDWLKCFQARVI